MLLARALLALACAAALVAADDNKLKCLTTKKGSTGLNHTHETELPTLIIKAGVPNATITFPKEACLFLLDPVGVEVTACDQDDIPELEFTHGDVASIKVTRKGKLLTDARVDVILYCKNIT